MCALMSRIVLCEKAALRRTKLPLVLSVLLRPLAHGPSNLGELLDAGAKKLSAEEFREELVQRLIVGPTATGGSLRLCTQLTEWYRG
jgi:hypothetical protein